MSALAFLFELLRQRPSSFVLSIGVINLLNMCLLFIIYVYCACMYIVSTYLLCSCK